MNENHSLVRHSIFDDNFYPHFNNLFENFFPDINRGDHKMTTGLLSAFDDFPKVSVYTDKENNVVIEAALAGIPREDIDITIEEKILSFKYESKKTEEEQDRSYLRREIKRSSFERKFVLPDGADIDNINTDYNDGLAVLTIPILKPDIKKITL